MQIIDEHGKIREVLSVKKVVHQIPDKVHEGIYINAEFVEIIIIGHNMTWKNWIPLDEFRKLNPEVKI